MVLLLRNGNESVWNASNILKISRDTNSRRRTCSSSNRARIPPRRRPSICFFFLSCLKSSWIGPTHTCLPTMSKCSRGLKVESIMYHHHRHRRPVFPFFMFIILIMFILYVHFIRRYDTGNKRSGIILYRNKCACINKEDIV
jgi:hypothetical protein